MADKPGMGIAGNSHKRTIVRIDLRNRSSRQMESVELLLSPVKQYFIIVT